MKIFFVTPLISPPPFNIPSLTIVCVQGMLKELRCLVSTSATSAAAAPSAAASALFSQIAATEYRRHSAGNDTEVRDSIARLVEEEAEEAVRRSEVEANLLAEQEAGVAAVVAVAETEKKGLEEELEHAGATIEEKEVNARGWGICDSGPYPKQSEATPSISPEKFAVHLQLHCLKRENTTINISTNNLRQERK